MGGSVGNKKRVNSFTVHTDTCIYLKIVGLQAELGLGHSFAALYPLIEGLNTLGKLTPEEYEFYRNRYTVKLEDVKPSLLVRAEKESPLIQTRAAERKSVNRHFGGVLEQWAVLNPKSRAFHLKEAAKHPTLKNAKLVLALGKQDAESAALES